MIKYYKRTSLGEIVKDELLGLVFGFLGALILKLFKEDSPSTLFYLVPAFLGLTALITNLLGNLAAYIRTDTEGITKFKFSLFKTPGVDVYLPWQKINEVDLKVSGIGFLKYKVCLRLKGNDQSITVNHTVSDFKELLRDVFSRATSARYGRETTEVINVFYKDLINLISTLRERAV